jgi:hypothetical protein
LLVFCEVAGETVDDMALDGRPSGLDGGCALRRDAVDHTSVVLGAGSPLDDTLIEVPEIEAFKVELAAKGMRWAPTPARPETTGRACLALASSRAAPTR